MKYQVDSELCAGHGRCWTVAAAVFEADDDGFEATRGSMVAVPDDLAEVARRGARSCPEGAIELYEDA